MESVFFETFCPTKLLSDLQAQKLLIQIGDYISELHWVL
jgi:hypothetical protein